MALRTDLKHLDSAQIDAARDAIQELSDAETERLERYAAWRMRMLGYWARGQDAHDLLFKAMVDTMEGTRNWDPRRVDLVKHLIGAMRSISRGWKDRHEQKDVLAAELQSNRCELLEPDPMETLQPLEPLQERVVEARELLKSVERTIKNDSELKQVLECLREGFTGPETMEYMDLSENQYRAAVRRLRRRAEAAKQKLTGERGDHN